MENKQILVAVLYDKEKKCERVAKVYYVSQNEYNALVNEQEKFANKEQRSKEQELKDKTLISQKIEKLEKRDIMLAKSIYDNFVDRGDIEDDAQFQKDFFDFVFNDESLNELKMPKEFKKILRKVGNL